ncbi:MFS transporter [Dongia sp.]|uniref:MFS transporter n=1 Tax=Dongia sp. TaxID=1977262 RepID=UPI0035AFCCA0
MAVDYPPLPVSRRKPGAIVFAVLYMLESTTRALALTMMPLQARMIFGDDAKVSAVYFGITIFGLLAGFGVPLLIHRFRRRWVYAAGLAVGGLALVALSFENPFGQISGQIMRTLSGTACIIALTLYVLDFIPRGDLVRYEPLKLLLGCLPWGLGPWIGIELYEAYGPWAVAGLGMAAALAAIALFGYLRLTENPAVAAATKPPPNPLASIGRFVAQPRLRLAWLIAFGRSGWWSLFFVYPALYFDAHGVDPTWSGALAGGANLLLVFSPLVGWLGRRYGIRRPIMVAFFAGGLLTIAVPLFFGSPIMVGIMLMLAAVFVVMLDALGNIPFLRAVKPLERPQMTSVFRTYIDLGSLLPFAVFTALLHFFDQRAVYVSYGLLMLVVGLFATYLPRRL